MGKKKGDVFSVSLRRMLEKRERKAVTVALLVGLFILVVAFTRLTFLTPTGYVVRPIGCIQSPSGLVSWWTLDDGNGTSAVDFIDSGYNLDLATGASWGSGISGSGLYFDGNSWGAATSTDFDVLGITNEVSWEFWFKPGATQNQIFAMPGTSNSWKGNSVGQEYITTAMFYGDTWVASQRVDIASNKGIQPGVWHHFVGVYDGAYIKMYIDGVLQNDIKPLSNPLHGFGWTGAYSIYGYDGAMDEMAIYNNALTANEISDLYTKGKCKVVSECIQPPANLVSWWTGDGTTDDFVDGNHGTLVNGATFAAGVDGDAFSFDGVDDYVNVPASANLDITNEITIDAWVYRDGSSVAARQSIVYLGTYGARFRVTSDGKISFLVGDGTVGGYDYLEVAPGSVGLDAWHHVAATFDGTIKLYVDGVLVGSKVTTKTLNLTGLGDLTIGRGYGGSENFGGLMDEIEIFSRVLDITEIADIYNNGKCKVAPTVPAIAGSALQFDGSDTQYVTLGNVLDQSFEYDQPFSFDFWLWMDDVAGSQDFFSTQSNVDDYMGWSFWRSGGRVYFTMTQKESTPKKSLIVYYDVNLQAQWNHIILTYDGSNDSSGFKFYLNGDEKTLTIYRTLGLDGSIATARSLDFGRRPRLDHYFYGRLDEVVFYKKVLSQSDVTASYAGGGGLYHTADTDTIGLWHFDDEANQTEDSSSQGNDGYLEGTTWVTGKVNIPGEDVCGNGNVETGEQCDDGNTVSGDGCSSACKFEGTDLNGDGFVNIIDIQILINTILGRTG